ncbi:TIGR02281 family clan AA aspartic protease [[Pseudomonas] carboxydohydrogena]|uniref:TIGR02281 family clan AA aspartic protease n=1 Tax=Afipia carboxydohydrogena TaxID=290 RepID=A0ABY8BQ38_AFICR|nr:TIGR02281 family clan AA aspartic protease [[Pseudomonas] carboxydohydrogena]WEF52068.1 TIGR02281 family clan AA aspartic protease [[Pseudomonas] carboxydohydrogena]
MRTVLIVAIIMAASGSYIAKVAERLDLPLPAKADSQPAKVMNAYAAMPDASSGSRRVSLRSDRSGHFRTEARVDGRDLDFLVDTGATVIALTQKDAERIGIRPFLSDYTTSVNTANGPAKAARARINRIDIGGVVVRDVDALVMPEGALQQNLLGMAYLSKLKRFEYSSGNLVLEQ